jgi:hypothetical protein
MALSSDTLTYSWIVVLMSKNKDWYVQNQVNVSKKGVMSTHGLLF